MRSCNFGASTSIRTETKTCAANNFFLKCINKTTNLSPAFLTEKGKFVLSVRITTGKNLFMVRHYKIEPVKGGSGYYITPNEVFTSIKELTNHFSRKSLQFTLVRYITAYSDLHLFHGLNFYNAHTVQCVVTLRSLGCL